MSDALINLSQAIDRMHRAGKLEDELTRFRKLEQAREEAAVYLRILEEQEVESEYNGATHHPECRPNQHEGQNLSLALERDEAVSAILPGKGNGHT